MKVSVIFNPASGSRHGRRNRLEKIRKSLSENGRIDFTIFETAYPGHASQLARESALRQDHICFAAGGDGTMNEVATGLMGSQTSLGIIPMGSGNGLARHLQIPLRVEVAIKAQLNGQSIPMDCGDVNNIPFFLAAGIGFEGAVAARFATKKSRGFISYLFAAAEEFFRWKPLRYRAKYEEENIQGEAFTIDFANGSQYGNNAIISPGASTDDGLLQFVRVLPFPLSAAPEMFFQLLGGKINRSGYHIERAFTMLQLSIEGQSTIAGHVDGEPLVFQLPLMVRVHPKALLVRAPEFH